MYYSIVSLDDGWGVCFGDRLLETFGSYVEARAYIKGRRALEATLTQHGAKRAAEEAKAKQSAAQTS